MESLFTKPREQTAQRVGVRRKGRGYAVNERSRVTEQTWQCSGRGVSIGCGDLQVTLISFCAFH